MVFIFGKSKGLVFSEISTGTSKVGILLFLTWKIPDKTKLYSPPPYPGFQAGNFGKPRRPIEIPHDFHILYYTKIPPGNSAMFKPPSS